MREKTIVKRCWKIGAARSLLLQPSTILSKSLKKKDMPRDHYTYSHLLICFIQFFLCIIELSLQLVKLFKRILFQLDPKSFLLSFQILNFSVKNLKGVRNLENSVEKFGSISVSGQLPTYPSLTQQQSIDNNLGLMLG